MNGNKKTKRYEINIDKKGFISGTCRSYGPVSYTHLTLPTIA